MSSRRVFGLSLGRVCSWAAALAAAALVVAACGGGGGSSSDSGWYYHFICNGDSQCQQLNFTPNNASSGTSSQGPGVGGQSGCNSLMNFGRINWNIPPAQQWCDNASNLTAPPAVLASIRVTPANKTLALGLTQQYVATGIYSDGSSRDITAQVTWYAPPAGIGEPPPAPVASIGSGGLATASKAGSIAISATLGSISGSTTLFVGAATLQSITVSPANPTVNQYLTQQFSAIGHYSNGTTQALTSVTWNSNAPAVASIGSGGLASALAAGTSTITASTGALSASTLMTVSAVTLQSIAVTPVDPGIAKGFDLQMAATGTFSDASVRDISAQVSWTSADPVVAPISGSGLVTALNLGSSLVSASLAGHVGTSTVSVTPAVLLSIAVTPANPRVETSLTKQLTATGTYSDASTLNVTAQATWTSGTTSTATVNGSALATGIAAGTSLISASLTGVSGSTTLTVTTLGSNWLTVTSGSGGGSGTVNALMGVAWTGTRFVAVGAAGTIMTSPDGTNWTPQSSGTGQNLNAVTWTGTQLVAVGTGTILTSPDGVTWTARTSGTALALLAVTWTGSQLVAVGAAQTTLTSPNGITWTPLGTLGYGNDFSCIAWSGTVYVACLGIATSPDAINWTISSSQAPHGVVWTGTRFVVVTDAGLIYVLSAQGSNANYPYSGSSTTLRAVAWSGSYFAAVGDSGKVSIAPDSPAYLTTNGSAWTTLNSGTTQHLRGVAWSGARFVAVGDAGTILYTVP